MIEKVQSANIMNHLKIFFGIFIVLSASRFIPHPPNFTSLLALSFYVPALLGRKYLPALLISFIITDLIIGYHNSTHWTWGSVFIIGLMSQYFSKKFIYRIFGALTGAVIFFLITNFGVWTTGMYGYSFDGIKTCFILAIPFFTYSLISTIVFSSIIELVYNLYQNQIHKKIV